MSELQLLIRKSILKNQPIEIPPSKSYTHRALIAAALSKGKTVIKNPLLSDDTSATIYALQKLGVKIKYLNNEIEVDGRKTLINTALKKSQTLEINCSESGTTLRFMLPLCSLLNGNITLTGKAGLCKRPIGELVNALQMGEAKLKDTSGFSPVIVRGGLKGGEIKVRGDISSQFISGLLFALPLAEKDSTLEIIAEAESIGYIEMTLDILKTFGIEIETCCNANTDGQKHEKNYGQMRRKMYKIKGNQKYRSPGEYIVECDYSSLAFLCAAGILAGPEVKLNGVIKESKQRDSEIIPILQSMGGNIKINGETLVAKKSNLKAGTIDVKDIPDLVPILAVIATQCRGKTKIINAGRLRLKESNRLLAISKELKLMGADIIIKKDSLEITGPAKLKGSMIAAHNDHRIAMACSIAGLIAERETILTDPEVIKKSYPDFFYHLRQLGAVILSETSSIGEKIKVAIYGGSHEKLIGVRIHGVPKGTPVSLNKIQEDIDKRKPFGDFTTLRREKDILKHIQGIKNGKATGETLIFEIENQDVSSQLYEEARFTPRPGHGDYTALVKYGGAFDFRGGGFLSSRMTACTVVAGSIAKQILGGKGVIVAAYVKQIGRTKMKSTPALKEAIKNTYKSYVRCPDLLIAKDMIKEIEKAKTECDSLGGIIECQVHGLPVGIGEPVFHAVDSVLAHYFFSVPAVKGVEFGAGFSASEMKGSQNNDEFKMKDGKIVTQTNNAGGVLGGITNGMPLICRVAIKPASSIKKEQNTVDMKNMRNRKINVQGRHDTCVAIRAPIIVESMAALGIADLLFRSGLEDTGEAYIDDGWHWRRGPSAELLASTRGYRW